MFLRIHMFSELRIPHKLSFVAAISDRVQFSNNCCNKLERYMGHISISTLCLFHNFLSWKCGYKMHLNISVFEQTLPSTLKFNYNIGGHTTEVPNGIIKVPLLAKRGKAALLFLVRILTVRWFVFTNL